MNNRIDLSDLKIDDICFSSYYGYGIVKSFDENELEVYFVREDGTILIELFEEDGRLFYEENHPILFHSKDELLEYFSSLHE